MNERADWTLYQVVLTTLLGIVLFALVDHFFVESSTVTVGGIPELILGNSYLVTAFHALCVLLILVAGVGLYFVRCRRPALYGQIEIFSGLGAALFASTQLTAGIATGTVAPPRIAVVVFAAVAALYVIARGLDNIHKSLTGKSKETWENFFFAPAKVLKA
jgi:hypothetical protein